MRRDASPRWRKALASERVVRAVTCPGATHTFSSAAWRAQASGVDGGVARIVVKRILMVAFHYPPAFGSSGVQRCAQVLAIPAQSSAGCRSCSPRTRAAHANRSPAQLEDVPAEVIVKRAFALDMRRLTSPCAGAIRAGLALPDRWGSWMIGGLPAGLALIRKYRPEGDLVHLSDRDGDAHRLSPPSA